MQLCNMAELRKRGSGIPSVIPPCGKGIYIRWQHLIFVLCTQFSCIKNDLGILHIFGCWAIDLPSIEQIFKYTGKIFSKVLLLVIQRQNIKYSL